MLEAFKKVSTHSDFSGDSRYVTFPQAKRAMTPVLKAYLKDKFTYITDAKLACILRIGQVIQKIGTMPEVPIYDYHKILNTYKERY